MTKLAIPYFGSRVAPRLDGARNLLLLKIENGEIKEKQSLQIGSWSSAGKLRLMKDRVVDVVICGGIDQESLRLLRSSGIELYSWVTGEVDDAITLFLKGDLKPGAMLDLPRRSRRRGRSRRRAASEGSARYNSL